MAGIRFFNLHRTWEDWLGIVLGVLVGLSPWIAGQTEPQTVMWNAIIVGILVLALAEFELVALHRWQETGEVACGLWLIASPYTFGYAGTLANWHYGLGAVVVLLALLELWQDWKLSDKELARHGQ